MMIALLDAEERSEIVEKVQEVSSRTAPRTIERDAQEPVFDAEIGQAWYEELEQHVVGLAQALPAGIEDFAAKQLLLLLFQLRPSVSGTLDAEKARGNAELALAKMQDVTRRMRQELETEELKDPAFALERISSGLDGSSSDDLVAILGVSKKTLSVWSNSEDPPLSTDNLRRVRLVAALVSRLQLSRDPAGIVFWFRKANQELGKLSPVDLMDADLAEAEVRLPKIARAGRANLG